ncbi:unnamed protein product [Porites lobata]|uniref:Uncharacterized protein n=1 Tax=Porites lobata TaxID=104759 RepID=A0ABN8P9N2_9CNID|nr:unnamed protein product [Porites lobata]
MPSPHDLLLGCKPQTTLPGRKSILKYEHPDNEIHHKANQRRQQRQAVFYDRKASSDNRPLSNQEPVFHPGTVLNRPQPMERPLAYKVDIQGTIYQRTREHLRPRSQSEGHVTPSAGSNFPLAVAPVHSSNYARIPNIRATRPPQLAEASPKGSTLTPDQLPHSKLPCREKQADLEPAGTVPTSERTGQPKAKLLGRDTSHGSQQSLKIK